MTPEQPRSNRRSTRDSLQQWLAAIVAGWVLAYLTAVAVSYLDVASPWPEVAGLSVGAAALRRAAGLTGIRGLFFALGALIAVPCCIGVAILVYLLIDPTARAS